MKVSTVKFSMEEFFYPQLQTSIVNQHISSSNRGFASSEEWQSFHNVFAVFKAYVDAYLSTKEVTNLKDQLGRWLSFRWMRKQGAYLRQQQILRWQDCY